MNKALLVGSANKLVYNELQALLGDQVFRPTIFIKEAVPGHGEQAHTRSEKPKVITN